MKTQTSKPISAADAATAERTVRSGVERLLRIYSRRSQGPAVNAAARRMMCQLLDTRQEHHNKISYAATAAVTTTENER